MTYTDGKDQNMKLTCLNNNMIHILIACEFMERRISSSVKSFVEPTELKIMVLTELTYLSSSLTDDNYVFVCSKQAQKHKYKTSHNIRSQPSKSDLKRKAHFGPVEGNKSLSDVLFIQQINFS